MESLKVMFGRGHRPVHMAMEPEGPLETRLKQDGLTRFHSKGCQSGSMLDRRASGFFQTWAALLGHVTCCLLEALPGELAKGP